MKAAALPILIILTLAVLATLVTWRMSGPIFDTRLTGEVEDTVAIAAIDDALTFARTKQGNVVLVLGAEGSQLSGIDLTAYSGRSYADTIDAYHKIGTEALVALGRSGSRQTFAWHDLTIPVDAHYPHVAAGTNFRAHAEEIGHEGDPFLFPKLSRVTAWNADVLNGARLDYEVEVCAVPIADHTTQNPANLAYLMCGDFTDRWTLVMDIDTDGVMGRTGFPTGKGGATRLPVGALLVIPAVDDFYNDIDMSLYVNNELRQRASAQLMIWSPTEILARTLADCRSPYYFKDAVVSVSACDVIPARTMILTGTPAGVLFNVATIWNPLAYLADGDVVVSTSNYLGFMQNEITSQ